MNLWAIFVPLIAFAIADSFSSPKIGIYSAILSSIGFMVYDWSITGELDWTLFLEPVVIIVCGVVSIRMQKTGLFRYQPTIVGLVFTIFIFGMNLSGNPILVRYWGIVERQLSAEQMQLLNSSPLIPKLPLLSWTCGWVFLVHAIAMFYITKKYNNVGWILGRLMIYPLLVIVMMLVTIL